MGVREDETDKRPGWPLGIVNRVKESATPLTALRVADNVDLDALGKPSRRPGYAVVAPGTTVHSAWSDDYLPWGLYVAGDTLRVFHSDESSDPLVGGLALGQPVSYARINDVVLWSNGVQCGAITQDLEAVPWACPSPASQAKAVAMLGGALDAGTYQVAVTFIDAFGRESGAGLAATIDVAANGAIELSEIPQPVDTLAVPRVRIYATAANDPVLRAAATMPAGVTTYTLTQHPAGRPLDTQHLRSLPPGQLVRYGNGRQFVARGREVLWSPALRYGLYDPRKARVAFAQRVDMMEFVGDGTDAAGLYVSDAKRTYFLPGRDPAEWRQVIAYPCGAVPGASTVVSGEAFGLPTKVPVPVWLARNGLLCVGLPGGQVVTFRETDAVIDQAERGALLYREGDGLKQVIASLQGAQAQGLAVRDRAVARVYRHDTGEQ